MKDNSIRAVCIKPNEVPTMVYIKDDVLEMSRLVNIDIKGNTLSNIEGFKIVKIKDNINIISSPNGEEHGLPLVRKVGKHAKFYGAMYIVKMDSELNFVSLNGEELVEYCVKFVHDEISLEDLGVDIDYGNRENGKERIEIWCDNW